LDLAKKISHRSSLFFVLLAKTLHAMLSQLEKAPSPCKIARKFMRENMEIIKRAFISMRENIWKNNSIQTVVEFLSSLMILSLMAEEENIIQYVKDLMKQARNIILKTLAHLVLKEHIDIISFGHLTRIYAFAPIFGDKELLSVIFWKHPIITEAELMSYTMNRINHGLARTIEIHLATMGYKKYIGEKITKEEIDLAYTLLDEIKKRQGEEATVLYRWLLEKILGE